MKYCSETASCDSSLSPPLPLSSPIFVHLFCILSHLFPILPPLSDPSTPLKINLFSVPPYLHFPVLRAFLCLTPICLPPLLRILTRSTQKKGKNVGLLHHLSSALPIALIQQHVTTFLGFHIHSRDAYW